MNKLIRNFIGISLLAVALWANDLNIGQAAPDFMANDDEGNLFELSDYLGQQTIVLYFYPAAMTFGCTNQACNYRDSRDELAELGVKVIGVSGDAVRNLAFFKQENRLNFTLVSDLNGQIANLYGVPVRDGGTISRKFGDKKEVLTRGATSSRWTFIIDKQGKIVYKDTSVNPAKDVKAVIDFVEGLK